MDLLRKRRDALSELLVLPGQFGGGVERDPDDDDERLRGDVLRRAEETRGGFSAPAEGVLAKSPRVRHEREFVPAGPAPAPAIPRSSDDGLCFCADAAYVTAALTRRRLLVATSLTLFMLVFAADALWERPGLGIGHFFYLAIALLALAGGTRVGAAGGVAAVGLYALAIVIDPHIAPTEVFTVGMMIRATMFVSIGALIGWYASTVRRLLEELQILAQRDVLTDLPNTRAFEAAITRRLDAGCPFSLLLGDIDALMTINHDEGRAHGNDVLRALADVLREALGSSDEIARVGGDEFAILATTQTSEEAAHLAVRLERIATDESPITFGWSSFPQDGENALSLYRAADERLYARKLVRGRRLGDGGAQLRAVAT